MHHEANQTQPCNAACTRSSIASSGQEAQILRDDEQDILRATREIRTEAYTDGGGLAKRPCTVALGLLLAYPR